VVLKITGMGKLCVICVNFDCTATCDNSPHRFPELPRMVLRNLVSLVMAGWLAAGAAVAVDLEKGKEINGTCAACHGDQGAGGKRGEYPRIAGQRVTYIENQLRNFRSRTRVNIPMFPYTQERELSDEDIKDVSAYLAGIQLSTSMPTYTGKEDALTKLLMADRVMIIPRAEGNIEHGGALYQKQCAACHARTGKGRGMFPMLIGQYTNYLRRQVDLYLKGDRPHDEEGTVGVLNGLKEQEIQDILAYLTSIQETTE
jgi:cytochrome c553